MRKVASTRCRSSSSVSMPCIPMRRLRMSISLGAPNLSEKYAAYFGQTQLGEECCTFWILPPAARSTCPKFSADGVAVSQVQRPGPCPRSGSPALWLWTSWRLIEWPGRHRFVRRCISSLRSDVWPGNQYLPRAMLWICDQEKGVQEGADHSEHARSRSPWMASWSSARPSTINPQGVGYASMPPLRLRLRGDRGR